MLVAPLLQCIAYEDLSTTRKGTCASGRGKRVAQNVHEGQGLVVNLEPVVIALRCLLAIAGIRATCDERVIECEALMT